MAHLIKVDFTCIAKCDMLRLLVTSIIAHMPPASPAREDQVSSTTIKVRITLQLQWCIFFHNRDWSIVTASSSLHTVQTHQCITASQEESELWRMILPQCMHVAFYWFWQETTTNLGNTLTYSPAGFFGEWQHLATPHMGRERERHSKRGGQSEGQGDSRSVSWRRPLAMRIRTQLTRKHWIWMSFLKLKKSTVQGPPSQPTNNGTKWRQYLFHRLSLGPSYRSHASSLFFG